MKNKRLTRALKALMSLLLTVALFMEIPAFSDVLAATGERAEAADDKTLALSEEDEAVVQDETVSSDTYEITVSADETEEAKEEPAESDWLSGTGYMDGASSGLYGGGISCNGVLSSVISEDVSGALNKLTIHFEAEDRDINDTKSYY